MKNTKYQIMENTNYPGFLITLEGPDGVGKTIQAQLLNNALQNSGINSILLQEPWKNPELSTLYNALKIPTIHVKTKTLIFFALRNELYQKVVIQWLAEGGTVVCDRSNDSTFAYQGGLEQDNVEHIMQMKHMIMGNIDPDCTFLLFCPAEKIQKRLLERAAKLLSIQDPVSLDEPMPVMPSLNTDKELETKEAKDIERIQILIDCYKRLSFIFRHRIIEINANKNIDKIHAAICAHLTINFPDRFHDLLPISASEIGK